MTLPAIDWALKHMPLTAAAVAETSPLLAGRRLAMCLHVEPKTGALVSLLARAGVGVTLTGSPGTTHDDVAGALRELGVTVHTRRADDDADHVRNVAKVLENEADALHQRLVRPWVGTRFERTLQVVDHRQQLASELRLAARKGLGGLLGHPLAVVLEVGLDALRDVLVLVALGGQLGDLGRDLRGQLVLDLLGGSAIRASGGAPVRGDRLGAVLLGGRLAVVRERRHDA